MKIIILTLGLLLTFNAFAALETCFEDEQGVLSEFYLDKNHTQININFNILSDNRNLDLSGEVRDVQALGTTRKIRSHMLKSKYWTVFNTLIVINYGKKKFFLYDSDLALISADIVKCPESL